MNTFPPPVFFYTMPAPKKRNMAVAAMVLGTVGCVIGLIPILGLFALICGVLALVFGLVKIRNAYGRGFAIAGVVLGLCAITLGAAGMVITNNALNKLDRDMQQIMEEND